MVRVLSAESLDKFESASASDSKIPQVNKCYSFFSNRRADFDTYSHGPIGPLKGSVSTCVGEVAWSSTTKSGEAPAIECYNLFFDSNGTAIVRSFASQQYWALNVRTNVIEWVDTAAMAVRMEIYLLDTLDVVIFKHGDKFLSFMGSVPNNAAAMIQVKLGQEDDQAPATSDAGVRTPSPSSVTMIPPDKPPASAAPGTRRKLQSGSPPSKESVRTASLPPKLADTRINVPAKPAGTNVPDAGKGPISAKPTQLTGTAPNSDENIYMGDEVSRCLITSQAVTENSFFYAPKIQTRDLNAQVVSYRQKAIEAKKEAIPSPFMAYEMALSIANGMEISEFRSPILNDPYTLFNVLFTMTQVVVVNIPAYRKMYGSFGKRMAQDFDITQLIDVTEASVSLSAVTDSLLRIAQYPIPLTTITPARQVWSGSLSAIVAHAWLRNVEKKEYVFAQPTITTESALQLYYSSSCKLATLMLPNATLLQKLNFTEILTSGDAGKEYIGKDANQQYWFSVFLSVAGEPVDNFKIFAQMGLILHLPLEVVQDANIGAEFTSNISVDGLKYVSDSDFGGIFKLTSNGNFGVLGALINAKCTLETRAQFCAVGSLMTQLSTLAGSLNNMFVQKGVTRLTSFAEVDTQKYLMQLIKQNAQEGIVGTIAKQRKEVFTFLQETMKQTIADIQDATIDQMLQVNGLLVKSQEELGKHLTRSSSFDVQSRQAQYERRMRAMKNALNRADERRGGMMTAVRQLSNRAKTEQIVELVIDTFETTLAVLTVVNPYGMVVDPARVGSLVVDLNRLSKSITNMVQLEQLRAFISVEGARRLDDILQRMVLFQKEIQRIYEPLKALITADLTVNVDGLAQHAAAFIAVYDTFRPTIFDNEVDEVRTLMSTVIDAFCSLINIDGFAGCVTAPAEVAFVFGSLTESIVAAMDSVDIMFHIASAALNNQNAQRITSEAETQSKSTDDSIQLLKNKWADDAKKREEWWSTFRNDLSLSESMASLGILTSHANLLQAIIQYCDELTYKNGGNPIPVCGTTVYQLKPISSAQIELLASYEASASTQSVKMIASIPTRPQFPGDTSYLPLGKLMRGESVPFLLPNNVSLLTKFQWLTSAQAASNSSTVYVRDIKIFAFPPYANYATQRCPVKITVSFPGFSSFGSALRNKVVVIPRTRFINNYEEQPRSYIGQCPVVQLPIRDCSTLLPTVCSRNGPTRVPTFLPPLFSRFFVRAEFPNRTSPLIDYDALATNLMLTAHVTYQVYKLGPQKQDATTTTSGDPGTVNAAGSTYAPSTAEKSANLMEKEEEGTPAPSQTVPNSKTAVEPPAPSSEKKLLRRNLVEEGQQRCCPIGQYIDGLEQSCYQCPRGTKSRMAGLYCVSLSTANAATSTPSAPTASAPTASAPTASAPTASAPTASTPKAFLKNRPSTANAKEAESKV